MARVYVEAYGCSASYADSEMISGIIRNGGHTLVADSCEADLSVMVTCSVKDATAKRMVHRMKVLGSGPLVVAGCLPKAEPQTVARFAPRASMMGPNSIGRTLQIVETALGGSRTVSLEDTDTSKIGLPKVRLNPAVGIVEIASGCMSECTFCQTKLAKGGLSSYRVGDVVRQVESEVADGCREVWLSSTDNGCYGLDIGSDLPELVDAVSCIPRDFMVRVGMMNPMYMPRIRDALLASFESPRVYRFLHVPVQSGSDSVLAAMRRGHTSDTFRGAAKRFRERFGRFTIATDVIVGFPTETEDDFEKTVRLLEETRPDVVNLSRYSARPGTPAAEMKQVEVSEVKRRSRRVAGTAERISLEANREWIGWSGPVLFGEAAREGTRGRNYAYKPIFVDAPVEVGSTHTVEVTSATTHSLAGVIKS